ncbi:MAG: ROK family protein [Firmicutes bacterium]|nr:ROK family protein [Bacillota bacterium]
MRTANVYLMKEMNKNLVRQKLLEQKTATKQELTKMTDLSAMTVGSIIEELLQNGEVYEGEMIPSNGGRPAVEYCYNGSFSHAAIIYGYQKMNKNYISLRVINMLSECVYSEEEYLEIVTISHFDKLLQRAFEVIDNIGIIGFGLPGEEEEGTVTINDYPDLIGRKFIDHFQEHYEIPVIFENDANAAIFGYHQRITKHQAVNGTVAGLYFPRLYVPGMGLIINGKIYKGRQNFAGEFTQLPIDIKWEDLNYENKDLLYSILSCLLSIICCMIAPETIVLYGDFFSQQDRNNIKKETERLLEGNFMVNLEISTAFEDDYEYGLKSIILDRLYKSLFGELVEI